MACFVNVWLSRGRLSVLAKVVKDNDTIASTVTIGWLVGGSIPVEFSTFLVWILFTITIKQDGKNNHKARKWRKGWPPLTLHFLL